MARYKQLTCPEEIRITVCRRARRPCEFAWLLAREAEPAVLVDLCFAWILAIGRRGTASAIAPLRLELTRAARRTAGCSRRTSAAACSFEAERNALVFRSERPGAAVRHAQRRAARP